jgi:hypothetical protein
MGWPINRDIAYNFDALFSLSNDAGHIICLSDRDVDILISSLRFAHWPTRWVDSDDRILRDHGRTGDLYLANDYIAELEEKLMSSCGSEIRAGLEALAQAIANKACCPTSGGGVGTIGGGGTGGTGTTPVEPVPIDGISYTTPPDGFTTWSDYIDYKCSVATAIANDTLEDWQELELTNWVGLTTVSAILAVLGIVLSIPIAGEVLLLIVLFILAMGGSTIVDQVIGGLVDSMETVIDDYKCALYTSGDVPGAAQAAQALLEAEIDNQLSDPLAFYAKKLSAYWLTADSLNRLFEYDTSKTYPAGDCEACSVSTIVEFDSNLGTVTDLGGGLWQVNTVQTNVGGVYRGGFTTNAVPKKRLRIVEYEVTGGSWDAGGAYNYGVWYDTPEIDNGVAIFNLPLELTQEFYAIQLYSYAYFSATFYVQVMD